MSWSDWTDYFEGDIYDITEQYGDEAGYAVQEKVEELLEEFYDAINFADSEEEKGLAEEALGDFMFTESEAISIGEDFELEYIADQMFSSYKSQELIDRWKELGGEIDSGLMAMSGGGGGGGGGGGYSPPSPPSPEELIEREIKKYRKLLENVLNTEEEITDIVKIIQDLEKELKKLIGDDN